jgi:uncharacterized protein
MTAAEHKERDLVDRLAQVGSLIVAYSGGVDSTYLAYVAHRALRDRALAVTAVSPSYSRSHRQLAEEVPARFGFAHQFVETHEIDDPDYRENPADRCYFCKTELFSVLERLREELDFAAVAYGVNTDDTSDFRPGHRAAEERRILAPFLDVGLSKAEIRQLSLAARLPTAEMPASACLASRIPYGMEVTPEKLRQIDDAEEALRGLGFRQVRVRHHGDLARIEVAPEELPRALELERARAMSRALHDVGFRWVSLDLDGYRTGSLNEILQIQSPPDGDPSA